MSTSLIARIERAPEVRDLVSLGVVEAHCVHPLDSEGSALLASEIDAACEKLRRTYEGLQPSAIPHVGAARALYKSVGIDPTKTRPSSEALLRRALAGKPFPRVLPAVDLANLWAVLSGHPVGLYDTSKIEGERIELRLGRAGESYEGIRKSDVGLEGRLTLADARGPFGNPTSDSARTSVGEATTDLLYVLMAPSSAEIGEIDGWTAWLRERTALYFGAVALSGVLA